MTKQEAMKIKDEILEKEGSIDVLHVLKIDNLVLTDDMLDIIDKYTEEKEK